MNGSQIEKQINKGIVENNLSLLQKLITLDNVNTIILSGVGNTVLEECVQSGYIEGVRWILEQFGSSICKQNIVEALTRVISERNNSCFEYILRYCTKDMINTCDRYNECPLRCAINQARHTYPETINMVKMLIDKGACVDSTWDVDPWMYEYAEEVQERKRRCNERCRAILTVFKKKKAPKDMTKWMVTRWIKRL
jgi:hypothetical protein